MKQILLIGAGKSATVLINYLKQVITEKQWQLTVADNDINVASAKVGNHPFAKAIQLTIQNESERNELIQQADIVISMMPPALHYLVAIDCIKFNKHLLTASYIDENLKKEEHQLKEKGLLFLCEMGLDPGIDHMSAMQIINAIKVKGGKITSFKSHCGGLIAPESDNNPWHYKISWNPRNVIMAGKAGATFKENNIIKTVPYTQLFNSKNNINLSASESYAFYPNRDSLQYMQLYGLENIETFIRTTLRHPEFSFGWKNIVDLQLTDEEKIYETNGMSIAHFFQQHFQKHGFSDWLNEMLMNRLSIAKNMAEKLIELMNLSEKSNTESESVDKEILLVDEKGNLNNVNIEEAKDKAAETMASEMNEANIIMSQLMFLGIDDDTTLINQGLCSAADILQFIVEKKWALQPTDKDMIVMLHEIEYELNNEKKKINSLLKVKGEDALQTAMAKTVGLPLGIAAKLILEGQITETGLHIPIIAGIYQPVLLELKKLGIEFVEY